MFIQASPSRKIHHNTFEKSHQEKLMGNHKHKQDAALHRTKSNSWFKGFSLLMLLTETEDRATEKEMDM